jgi:hypothetical protein
MSSELLKSAEGKNDPKIYRMQMQSEFCLHGCVRNGRHQDPIHCFTESRLLLRQILVQNQKLERRVMVWWSLPLSARKSIAAVSVEMHNNRLRGFA